MEVKVLGSVSPYPKDNKNGPGFLVRTDNSSILLDCGSGITRLMDMSKDLENLSVVISHLHRDHYSDIGSLAYATYVYHNLGMLDNRVKVYIPSLDKLSAEEYFDYQLLTNLGDEHYLDVNVYDTSDTLVVGDCRVSFSSNPHSIKSNSVKVSDGDVSLVYSGDTGFSGNTLESLAKNSTLFICEATFLRGQKGAKDYHLTAFEAGKIASIANVKDLMLTHFWPEIDKQEYVKEAQEVFLRTSAAEEGKVLKLTKN